tara:strand:+ start:158 stop:613 length:456 start_codon:yes stop_codon:yes gene_type:complete
MFRLSKKMLFTIEAVLDIAYHAGSGPVQSREITKRQGIPRRYLEQALQNLVRHKILIGVRGPRGGYRLARERRRISVGDVARVVANFDSGDDFADQKVGSELSYKVVRPFWTELREETLQRLDGVSIDDLCTRADGAGVASKGRDNLDFSI